MLEILFPSLKKGKKCTIFLGLGLSPDPPTVLGAKLFEKTLLSSDTSQYAVFFRSLVKVDFFFTSGIGPVVLMKVFKEYIIFLIWAAWVLFNFYLKQKQILSVWRFTENASFISFHKEIWSIPKDKKCRFLSRQLQV